MKTQPPNPRLALGRAGEAAAARFLELQGYRIVARNVRADRVEIDLIARRGPLLVFVEVKARRGKGWGSAAEAVDGRKQRRLRRGARAWLAGHPPEARGMRSARFDVVTCMAVGPVSRADHALRGEPERGEPPNETTARPVLEHGQGVRWTFEHWKGAF